MNDREAHYDAFISYRHVPGDIRTARMLQHALEHYHVPKNIRKATGRERISHIFRDNEELNASEDLSREIDAALAASDYLIVICSPDACMSDWVNREIHQFLKTHEHSRILAVLSSGEPAEAFPDALLHKEVTMTDEDGVQTVTSVELEPLAADLRADSALSFHKKLGFEKVRIASALLGCRYDDLKQRDNEYHFRQRMAISAVTALAIITALCYVINKNAILQQQYNALQISEAKNLAKTSGELLENGDRFRAVQVALAALPESEEHLTRPVTADALYALNNSMYSYNYSDYIQYCIENSFQLSVPFTGDTTPQCSVSPSGSRFMIIDRAGLFHIFSLSTSKENACISASDLNAEDVSSFSSLVCMSDDMVILTSKQYIFCYDVKSSKTVWAISEADSMTPDAVSVSPDGSLIACSDGYRAMLIDAASGKISSEISFQNADAQMTSSCSDIVFSPSGRTAAISIRTLTSVSDDSALPASLYIFDVKNSSVTPIHSATEDMASLCFLDEDHVAAIEYQYDNLSDDIKKEISYSISSYNIRDDKLSWTYSHNSTLNLHSSSRIACYNRIDPLYGDKLGIVTACIGNDFCQLMKNGTLLSVRSSSSPIAGIGEYDGSRTLICHEDGTVEVNDIFTGLTASVSDFSKLDISYFVYDQPLDKIIMIQSNSAQVTVGSRMNDDSISMLDIDSISGNHISASVSADSSVSANSFSTILTSMKADRSNPYTASAVNIAVGYVTDYMDEGTFRYAVRPASSDQTSTLFLWSTSDNRLAAHLPLANASESFLPEASGEPSLMISGQILYYLVYENNTACLNAYDIAAGKALWQKSCVIDKNIDPAPSACLDHSADGRPFAIFFGRQSFGVLDLRTDTWLNKYSNKLDSGSFISMGLSSDGKLCNTLVRRNDGTMMIQIYDLDSNSWTKSLGKTGLTSSDCILLAAKKNILAYRQEHYIFVIDMDSHDVISKIPCSAIKNFEYRFLNDDTSLLIYDDSGYLKLWDFSSNSITCEDKKHYAGKILITSDVSGSWFGIIQTQQASGLTLSTSMHVYILDGNSFSLLLNIPCSAASYSAAEAIYTDPYGKLGIFRIKTNDELLKKADSFVGGRKLTSLEKTKYNISE